uniref:Uncharacterized protein n=1 Tax=Anguilla anguilla TaxID=7936 RepID=A0A0E9VHF5_ANGAN
MKELLQIISVWIWSWPSACTTTQILCIVHKQHGYLNFNQNVPVRSGPHVCLLHFC